MNNPDNTVKEFLAESYENLDQLDRDLVALEKAPAVRATLDSIFRTTHTIKGSCGFLDFSKSNNSTSTGAGCCFSRQVRLTHWWRLST